MLKEGIFLGKRYEILERIGAGGMADVYKSKDHKLNRYVAVKVLKSDYRSDEVFIQKFVSEAQAAAGLMHPNVVNVYDVGQDRGLYYMVMELVEGITLKDYIEKKGKLSAKETISISIQMVTGIQAAHNQHIIHRDIKPQNIIISRDGKVKVTDFGIARATTSTNTISTNVMGSVHYTSPEQARGGIVDEKSDIYSAGITMYEMITGHVPFDGDSTVSVAIKHLREEMVSPAEEVPDIPYSLECIIMKCTQKSTARRYQNCQQLIDDLKRSLVDPDGDFVNAAGYVSGATETVVMSDEELRRVQRQRYPQDEDYDDDYDNDDYDNDDYDNDDYDNDDYNEDEREYSRNSSRNQRGKKKNVDPNTKKIMKILMIVAAVVIALAAVFLIGKAAGIFNSVPGITADKGTAKVAVPNVVGMTKEEAIKALAKRDLGYRIVDTKPSDKYESGEIMEQKTKANTKVAKNTTIELVESVGKEAKKVAVPDVAGKSEDDAQKILEDAKLVVENEAKYDDTVEAGKVISTDPAAGTEVTEGSKVKMYVSKGKERVEVPNLVGKTYDEAVAALSALGLNANPAEEYSDKASGTVLSQTQSAGKKVEKGSTIDFVVSKGKEQLTVPGLVWSTYEDAIAALSKSGLKPGTVSREYDNTGMFPSGYVMYQTQTEGSSVDRGSKIDFVVSKGVDPSINTDPDQGTGGENQGGNENEQ